ncbi:hypothetical protein [Vibrio phage J14]|nr:hypothetical protein [Vibrio phage J14]
MTDPLVGIIPEQINVTGRGDYFDDRDLDYASQMVTYQHPAVTKVYVGTLTLPIWLVG